AISWVLGEQSAKSLRGARMEDVIFAGTRDRKPLGLASVTMTLAEPLVVTPPAAQGQANGHSNGSNGHAAATNGSSQPSDMTITRRLFRSGESEYLINGKLARLRDIQDLFMGTGLGPESYAIIEQGRIGQILSNRPQDRRGVIEEAAGITKFRTRKRLAEAKLEGAKQNLTRVFDILEEVSRQVNSLKRQSAKTKRYAELRGEMIGQLRTALTGRFRVLEREAATTAINLNLAASEFQAVSVQVAEQETAHHQLQETCYRTEAELTEARKQLSDLHLDQERTRGRLDKQAHQIGAIEQRLAQGETESQELTKRHAHHQQELERHLVAAAELENEVESARARLNAKSADREKLQGALQERSRALETGRQHVLRLLGETSSLRNQLAKIEEYLSAVERDTGRSQREEETSAADLARLAKARAEVSQKLEGSQLELESTADQKRAIERELTERKSRAAEARRQLDHLRGEAGRLKARKDSLEDVLSHRAYTTDSVKRFFTAIEKGQVQNLKPVGVLADFVEVEPTFEKATEEFLHEELEYVVVSDWQDAGRAIDLMRTDLDGRATFLVHPEAGDSPAAAPHIEAEGIAGRLSDHMKLTNGLSAMQVGLIQRIAHCYLATDRAAAQRLAVQHPDAFFLLPDGVSYHGYAVSGGKKKGSGPLALKRELRELTTQLAAKQTAVTENVALLENLDREILRYSEEQERLRGLQQAQERAALALDHENRKLAEETARSSQRLSVARLELDRLRKESERALTQRERDRLAVEQKDAARQVEEQVLEQARADLDELQRESAGLVEEHSALRAGLAGLDERRRSEKAAQARFETQLKEIGLRLEQIAREMERQGAERVRLLSDNVELDQRAAQLNADIAKLSEMVRALAEQESGFRLNLAQLEESLKLLRTQAHAAQEKRSLTELELVKRQAELKYLDETSRKELNAPLEELAQQEETVLDEAGLIEAEQRYQELRTRIEALGPVNPQALEEFQEAQQRYDFLNAQRQDLLDSIRDTERAIQDIDVESRKRFIEAYDAINNNFREMFKTLFGGGTGEMRLTDEDNASESGIDIVASPPGKKLQSVLLLSGGEKSLTAMALLMAIFQYQPSPFCILDEVDAPLDEPNIERLTRLLKEMASQTQFIVITHAKRTMEAAQSLYGVTMQEPGVSKLVSVRFQPVEETPKPQVLELQAVGSN
ncbi:MAG: chromosome segregation protein SMC, partial [Acidobacteriota bacterium]|nr:chromosome segregation protein SMC [Acidobacteriota bacterium]